MRSVMGRRFLAVYGLELRLTCLHWSYLLLLALWSGFVVLTYLNDDLFSTPAMFSFSLGLGSLIGLMLAGIQASRSQRSRFDLLEIAFPTGAEILFARWLATITAIAGFLVAPLIVAFIIPSTQLDLLYLPRTLFLALLSFAFITGLIWIVQNTVGIRRWMYPLFAGFWLLGGMIPGTLSQGDLPVPGSNLLNFITMESPTNSLWGTLPQGDLPTWFALFYIGLVALFAGVMLWRFMVRRFYRRSWTAVALTAAALGLVILAGGSYTAQVFASNQLVVADRERAEAMMDSLAAPSEMPFTVTAYALRFAQGEPARFSAQMNVLNRSDAPITELIFSLYHQLEVTNASVPFMRHENSLILSLPDAFAPGATVAVDISYQGTVWVLERELGRPSMAADFTRPDGVNLSYGILWYPVPGTVIPNFRMYDYETGRTTNYSLLDQPATFRLTIEQPGTLTYTSNLAQVDALSFVSSGTTWATLVGATGLKTETNNGMTLTTTANGFDLIAPLARQFYEPFVSYLRQHFPEAGTLSLQVLDMSVQRQTRYPAMAESLFAMTSPRELSWMVRYPQNQYYEGGEPLIIGLFDGQDNPLTTNIAYFLWAHYLTKGEPEALRTIIEEGLPNGGSGYYFSQSQAERYRIAAALYVVYVTQGELTVFDILSEIHQQADTLGVQSVDTIVAWIEEHARAD